MGKCAITGMKCPQTNDQNAKWFCPLWTNHGVIWVNNVTNESKTYSCAAEALMPTCVEIIRAVNKPIAEIEEVRQGVINGFQTLANLATKRLSTLDCPPDPPES
jgi:hypothetical protein